MTFIFIFRVVMLLLTDLFLMNEFPVLLKYYSKVGNITAIIYDQLMLDKTADLYKTFFSINTSTDSFNEIGVALVYSD